MSIVQPRMAVGYHFYNDFDTEPEVRRRVRKTYDGPLSLAVDYMLSAPSLAAQEFYAGSSVLEISDWLAIRTMEEPLERRVEVVS